MENNLFSKRNIIAVIGLVIILLGLGGGMLLIRQRQTFHSKAAMVSGDTTAISSDQLGDATGDGCVDELDYNKWKLEKNKTSGPYTADFSGDGKVDQRDYQILRQHREEGCNP